LRRNSSPSISSLRSVKSGRQLAAEVQAEIGGLKREMARMEREARSLLKAAGKK
jgi:hypothetical protein